jgi:hypothetical protein
VTEPDAEIQEEVRILVREREVARRRGDYASADALRERIEAARYSITDTPEGPVVRPIAGEPGPGASPIVRAGDIPSLLDAPATCDVSIQWLVEGWPLDIRRGLGSFERTAGAHSAHHVVADLTDSDPTLWPEHVDLVRLEPDTGWGAARNAALRRARGRIVVVVDGSVEATGDVLTPLVSALADPSVGVTGPYGLVSDDLREFRESPGPDVDAVEAYLMAFRRELLGTGVRFDEKFRFYRSADIEFSFQVKARGLRSTITPVPVMRHDHRMWVNTAEGERARLSKRNFYRFLDRWRGRTDLLVRNRPGDGS